MSQCDRVVSVSRGLKSEQRMNGIATLLLSLGPALGTQILLTRHVNSRETLGAFSRYSIINCLQFRNIFFGISRSRTSTKEIVTATS